MERENYTCWNCYKTAVDVHEGVVSRGMVQGWPIKQRLLVHSPLNTIALCKDCHKYTPDRKVVFDWMIQEYGKELVLWYFENLPFKVNPIEYLLKGIK